MVKNNSLMKKYPEIAAEWSDKNIELSPSDVSYGSNRIVWWKGACGHEWEASVKSRTKGERCPYCSGKRVLVGYNDLATVHKELIEEWSDRNEGLDITCVTAGSQKKVWWKGRCGHEWEASVKNRANGSKCPYCSSHKIKQGENDLESIRPDIAREWSKRNYPVKPSEVMPNSNKMFWWQCSKGHEWKALVSSRNKGTKCPYCSGMILLPGFNDLATTNPELAEEWSDKNIISADSVNAKSRKSILWVCKKCGYRWSTAIYKRTRGDGCPGCKREDRIKEQMEKKKIENCIKKFEINYPALLLKYLLIKNGIKVVEDDNEQIGLKLQIYLPDYDIAITIQEGICLEGFSYRREIVRNRLCKAKGIRLFRILAPSDEYIEGCICIKRKDYTSYSLDEAYNTLFVVVGIDICVDSDLVYERLFKKYISGEVEI